MRRLGELGCTYLQVDDTSLAYMNDPHQRDYIASIGGDPERQHVEYIRHINEALAERPAGMSVTTHMCRGNFRSSWAAEGGYDFVAEALLNELEVDGFFMEWDDERSGGFEPLRFLPKGDKQVVLGLVTTKRGELESKDELKRRIEEASTYAPIEQLCLSPQCGFSSTVEGNALTEDEQWAKLALIVEVADEVWGLSRTVRDATFEVFRRRGLTTLFSNPGSTEVPFLAGLPDDLRFVLGAARGLGARDGDRLRARPRRARARARAHDRRPRQLRRRHRDRARQPGAARDHRRPAGPAAPRLRAVPGRAPAAASPASTRSGSTSPSARRTCRARSTAPTTRRPRHAGPAIVIVPMDDWLQDADPEREDASAGRVLRARAVDDAAVDELAAFLESGRSPALVVGAGADEPETWEALVELAERLVAPVFQESFGARAGFPQDHRLFAGFLPGRSPTPAGAPGAVRRRPRGRSGRVPPVAVDARAASPRTGTRLALVSDDPAEVHRSPVELAVLAPPAAAASGARRAGCRSGTPTRRSSSGPRLRPPRRARRAADGEPRAGRARGAPAGGGDRPRGGARRPARDPRPAARPRVRSASSAPPWAASASACPRRPGCAWRCRTGPWSRCSGTAHRSTASRGSGAPRTTAPACST